MNTGLIILLVNVNLNLNLPSNFPIFAGEYREFNVQWYRVVGSTLTLTMLLNVFTPHVNNAMI